MGTIPCTVGVLTYNSGNTLRRALESVREFSDIVICDGGSTDDTLSIAAEFGTRVISQDPAYLSERKIRDFAAVRNQLLSAANEQWYLWLDSDEYIDAALAQELSNIIQTRVPAAYWIPRMYTHNGEVVLHAVTYPTQQMRFFHRSLARGFIKPIHERVDLSVEAQWAAHPMYVPVPETVADMKRKWTHYLSIERVRLHAIPLMQKMHLGLREIAIACLYFLRLLQIQLFARGKKLPVSYELARIGYQLRLVYTMFL